MQALRRCFLLTLLILLHAPAAWTEGPDRAASRPVGLRRTRDTKPPVIKAIQPHRSGPRSSARLVPPRRKERAPAPPLETLRRLVLSTPPERLAGADALRGAKTRELLQAARSGRLSEHDVATFAQSAHPDLLQALEHRGRLPAGFFLSITRAVQFPGGNPFQSPAIPDPGTQAKLRAELESRLGEVVRLHQRRGGKLVPAALQLLTSTSQLPSPARGGYQTAIRRIVENLPLLELEHRHAYVMALSPQQVVAQMPSRPSLARRSSLINFDHLLGTLGRIDQGKLLVDVYAENMPAPGRIARYLPVAALGEGSYCVDDIARVTVALLQSYRAGPKPELLRSARAGLGFVRMMQAADGEFFNFASLKGGKLEVNRSGGTSRKGLDYWAVRAVWALGEASAALRGGDPRLAAEAARALERSLPRLEEPLRRYGEYATVEGRRVPAWLINNASDQTAVAVKGLLSYYESLSDGARRRKLGEVIGKYCDGIAAAQVKDPSASDRGRFLHSVASPSDRHLWGSQQVEVLAQAGKLLGRKDWIAAAALCADGYWARHTPRSILAPGEAQIAYGVETVVSGYARLFEATGKKEHAEATYRWASWFFGRNEARALMYDPVSGRGHDGITHLKMGRSIRYGINANAGAESTVEAILAMQSAERVPGVTARLRSYLAERLPR